MSDEETEIQIEGADPITLSEFININDGKYIEEVCAPKIRKLEVGECVELGGGASPIFTVQRLE